MKGKARCTVQTEGERNEEDEVCQGAIPVTVSYPSPTLLWSIVARLFEIRG